jgi:hypothetical protein
MARPLELSTANQDFSKLEADLTPRFRYGGIRTRASKA